MDHFSALTATRRGVPDVPPGTELQMTLPARADHVATVRHTVGAIAAAHGVGDGLVEDIRLAVTEGFTNVVRHAYRDGEGMAQITVGTRGGRLMVAISDAGVGMRPHPDDSGPGLGLPLITALTEAFEVVQPAGGGSMLQMTFASGGGTGRFRPTL